MEDMERKDLEPMNPEPQHPDYQEELIRIIRGNTSPKILQEKILDYHENDIAETMEVLTAEERARLYRVLDAEVLSDIFEYLEDVSLYFKELSSRKKVEVLSHMNADEAADLLKQIDRSERSILIDFLDDETKKAIELINSFDEDEIGSRMTTNFIEIPSGLTIREARHELVAQAAEHDNISTIYVVDEDHTFYGAIDLKDLIISKDTALLEDLILTSYPYVYAAEQISDCIERLKDYSEDSIPILNNENKLIGVITSQDIVEVVDAEMAEDYAKLAGLSSEEELNEPIRKSISKRFPWLAILLGLGMVVSGVAGLFEEVVSQLTVVVCFQSLILDMAGNVGTQSLAVTIRVLVDENLNRRQKVGFIWKESRVAFANGLIVGFLSFVIIGIYLLAIRQFSPVFSFAVSGCIGTAMLLAMLISGLAGTGIPILFKKIGIDPAVASGPLITTLNDLVAVVSYYGLTWIFLIQCMRLS